jgi:hypothetical protein
MALRVYSFGFGYGFTATAFFTTLYGLKTLREKDDIINYAVAGSFNSAILVSQFSSVVAFLLHCLIHGFELISSNV